MPFVWDLARAGVPFDVEVPWVYDGDSLRAMVNQDDFPTAQLRSFEVRLFGVDAPEVSHWYRPAQPMSRESCDLLIGLTRKRGGLFRFTPMGRDDFGDRDHRFFRNRLIGILERDGDASSINLQMVRAGMAWDFDRYGMLEGSVEQEEAARQDGVGVWGLPPEEREPPWVYRRREYGSGYEGR